MSLVKCPECQHLCFSDSQACGSCLREFSRGELRAKLTGENKSYDRKVYGVFLVLLILVLAAVGYAVYQGPVLRHTPESQAISEAAIPNAFARHVVEFRPSRQFLVVNG